MRAVFISDFTGDGTLEIREVPDPPPPSASDVLVRVRAAGLNRADLLQRRGLYMPPPGFSPNIPGLEFAGEIIDVGSKVKDFSPGERVFGITAGEAQAEYLTIDASLLAAIPSRLSFAEAAAVPEAFVTAHDAIITQAELRSGELLLIHPVGSGVGLAGLQIGKAFDASVIGTSRSANKLTRCGEFGLDLGIEFTSETDLAATIAERFGGRSADVILDLVGAPYFEQNLKCLGQKGRLMLVGLTGGRTANFDMSLALYKRATIKGTVLRSRSTAEKAAAMRAFDADVTPLFETGQMKPNLDRVFPFAEVRAAQEYLGSNESFGKVVLEW